MKGGKESASAILDKNNGSISDVSKWCLGEGTLKDKQEGESVRVMKYWLRLLETDETNPSLGQQKGKGNKWMNRIEQSGKAGRGSYLSEWEEL
jgi:hypothetical protein